jgi:hypothetical protein
VRLELLLRGGAQGRPPRDVDPLVSINVILHLLHLILFAFGGGRAILRASTITIGPQPPSDYSQHQTTSTIEEHNHHQITQPPSDHSHHQRTQSSSDHSHHQITRSPSDHTITIGSHDHHQTTASIRSHYYHQITQSPSDYTITIRSHKHHRITATIRSHNHHQITQSPSDHSHHHQITIRHGGPLDSSTCVAARTLKWAGMNSLSSAFLASIICWALCSACSVSVRFFSREVSTIL